MAGRVSIGTLVYDIIADTADFEKDLTASRKEIREANRVMNQAKTPADKYGQAIDRLNNLRKKGLIDSRAYRTALKQEADTYGQATAKASMFSKVLPGIGGHLKGMMGPLMAIASVGGISRAIFGDMEVIDETAKVAEKLGLATESLVGLQLAAAEFSGMGASQVNMALQRMTRRLSEAAAGTGEAQDAIKELGLDATYLNELGPAEAFREISEAMQGVENDADKLRLAFKLFDSEGAALVTTLDKGADGIDEMHERAKELGLTFSADTADAVEDANDAILEMKSAFNGLVREITVEVAPALEWLADGMQSIVGWYRDAQDALARWAAAYETFMRGGSDVRTIGGDPSGVMEERQKAVREAHLAAAREAAEQKKMDDEVAKNKKVQAEEEAKAEEERIKRNRANQEKYLNDMAALEKAKNKEIEDQRKRDKKLADMEEVDAASEAVKAAQDDLREYGEKARERASRTQLGQVGASGPTGEYQFLRDRQRARQQAKIDDKHRKRAERQRERYISAVEDQKAILKEIRDKQSRERTIGV